MLDYPRIPGKGLVTEKSTKQRLEYLNELGYSYSKIAEHGLSYTAIQNKIESFIGTVEVPIGLVGPLLFKEGEHEELVHAGAATLEGALVASMNRGVKAISLSGGFRAHVIHQKMVRTPMFIFNNLMDAAKFSSWVDANYEAIKNEVEKFSNHATLNSLKSTITASSVHTQFEYSTGDASGQNMTTTCTWHGMLWIVENFTKETGIIIKHYVVDGNSASDKKVSARSFIEGRGVHVVVECLIPDVIVKKILRTTIDDIILGYAPSVLGSQMIGMTGYNVNVANTIAAIYAATGQDLACVHESSVGFLNIEKKEKGLYLSLNLPTLVIGTIGGGTSLPKQNEMLQLMGCNGEGKIERFAKLIAGFALSLEISTFSAMISGEFAKAHENLGRNKPMNWLLRSELTDDYIASALFNVSKASIQNIEFKTLDTENGIITNLTKRVSKKLIGFLPFELTVNSKKQDLIIKSKALDIDVIKGLHSMAASIDISLSDLIYEYRNQTEYVNSHLKEILMYDIISNSNIECIPKYYGKKIVEEKEVYFIITERLLEDSLILFNSENQVELWTDLHIKNTIKAITDVHQYFIENNFINEKIFQDYNPLDALPLYEKLISIVVNEEDENIAHLNLDLFPIFIQDLKKREGLELLPNTIIHNDFNPRNIAIRKNNNVCIYDWELVVLNRPHRDIVELLSFVLPEDFEEQYFINTLKFHTSLWNEEMNNPNWVNGYTYALKEYLVSRVVFYKASEVIMKLKFINRVMSNCFRMIEILETTAFYEK